MTTIHKLIKDGNTIFPATVTDAVVHPSTVSTLTSMIKEYNVSELYPIEGIDGSNTYTLPVAIHVLGSHMRDEEKTGNIRVAFTSSLTGRVEEYTKLVPEWSEEVSNWRGVDDEPTEGSQNVVTSNGLSETYGSYQDVPEYLKVITDSNHRLILAIKPDGDIVYGVGIPKKIKEEIDNKIDKELGKSLIDENFASASESIDTSGEYIQMTLDQKNRILEGIKSDGTKEINIPIKGGLNVDTINSEVINLDNKNLNEKLEPLDYYATNDNPEWLNLEIDENYKILSGRKADGTRYESNLELDKISFTEKGFSEFKNVLVSRGFKPGGAGDYSFSSYAEIPMPRCAFVNITNDSGSAYWPTSKGGRLEYIEGVTADMKYYMEFYDGAGNYFKKEVIMSAQGNSSMGFEKKNGAVDICNNNGWDDEDTFKLKIGDWVAQDSFHFKAYHTDFIRGAAVVAYQICEEVAETRGVFNDRTWKKALLDESSFTTQVPTYCNKDGVNDMSLQIDNGARCTPDGFPAIFFLNGEFYGIYSWQLKKHRDNYHMVKSNPSHIHLDGDLGFAELWGGKINWSAFEVRNPKNLVNEGKDTYDPTVAYNWNDRVIFEGHVYGSTITNNLGNPVTDELYWLDLGKFSWKYDADLIQCNLAGNDDGSDTYDNYISGKLDYKVGDIVKYSGHLFVNTKAGNTNAPSLTNNTDSSPDFKNKNKSGWINVTNTVKVKKAIIELSKRIEEINSACYSINSNSEYTGYNYDDLTSITPHIRQEDARFFRISDGVEVIPILVGDTKKFYVKSTCTLDESTGKALFDTYFDAPNLVDYQVVNMAVNDGDSIRKNWQWTTWDGSKWYVNEYDKDCSFGNHFTGMFTSTPWNGRFLDSSSTSFTEPTRLVYRFYKHDIIDRWKELVDLGIFSKENFIGKLMDWVSRIGQDYYEKEWKKWPEAPCNRNSGINYENWEFTGECRMPAYMYITYEKNPGTIKANSSPQPYLLNGLYYGTYTQGGVDTVAIVIPLEENGVTNYYVESTLTRTNVWNESTQYTAGSEVWFLFNEEFMQGLKFRAVKDNIGEVPITAVSTSYPQFMGYRDSIWRFAKYVEKALSNMNNFINNQK